MTRKRIGLFGGTFNPVHNGHLEVANFCREQLQLELVYLITAKTPPHKLPDMQVSAEQRHEMVKLATKGNPYLIASDIELKLKPPSYTINTLKELRRIEPQNDFFLIIGGDTIPELPSWYKLQEILNLATIITVTRPGYPRKYEKRFFTQISKEKINLLNKFILEIAPQKESSTEIRKLLAEGKEIKDFVHIKVVDYIKQFKLYSIRK